MSEMYLMQCIQCKCMYLQWKISKELVEVDDVEFSSEATFLVRK